MGYNPTIWIGGCLNQTSILPALEAKTSNGTRTVTRMPAVKRSAIFYLIFISCFYQHDCYTATNSSIQ